MQLAAGARLGPYELVESLGAGGMGEVWRAKDTRLGRTVAIKVLARELAASPAARQRLEREAQSIAALAHPNICALHDVGESDGELFLIMEHLTGETLADRLRKGPLPLDAALKIASDIAAALAAAHAAGIIHRDLKPANIMLTRSGVKLLDFGLAKLAPQPVEPGTESRTIAKPLTEEGKIAGTIQYMSPEQLEGKELDARSDLFSFGCVLYEMLTGRRAFDGDSRASIIAKILTEEPRPLSEVQPLTPASLDQLVRSCLAKDPRERWQSAADLQIALRFSECGGKAAALESGGSATALRRWLAIALALALALAAFLIGRSRVSTTPRVPVRFAIAPEERGSFGGSPVTNWFALSPDGRKIVFAAAGADRVTRLWLRTLDSVTARPIPGTENAASPFWSPDGREIGFFAERAMKRVALDGGAPAMICERGEGVAAWMPNDTIVFGVWAEPTGRLWRVPGRGGVPSPLTTVDTKSNEIWHYWPAPLPDGKRLLFLRYRKNQRPELCAVSLDGGAITPIASVESRVAYAHPGRLLQVRGRTLVAQPFDAKSLRLSGDAVAVAEQIRNFAATSEAPFAVSGDGRVVAFHAGSTLSRLVWLTRDGARREASSTLRDFDTFRLSRDGQRVVASVVDPRSGAADLLSIHLGRDVADAITSTRDDERYPLWSHDERRIIYRGHNPDVISHINIYSISPQGGSATRITEREGLQTPRDLFGPLLLFSSLEGEATDLRVMDLQQRTVETFAGAPVNESDGRFSPDGRWIAYVTDEAGRSDVYVQPYPRTGEKWRISSAGGNAPRWRGDGRELYYLAPDRTVMRVSIDGDGQFKAPEAMFREPELMDTAWDAASDGSRFLMKLTVVDERRLPLTIAVDW